MSRQKGSRNKKTIAKLEASKLVTNCDEVIALPTKECIVKLEVGRKGNE